MRKGKRLLSWLLTAAMVITGVNLGTLTPVQAAEGETEISLELERFESGANTDANKNGKLVFITTSENNDTGNMNKGAGVNGTTYGNSPSVCGNNRVAGIQFKLPENVTAEEVDSAVLTINVANVDGCNLNSGWTKAALFETANPTSWSLDGSDGSSGNLKDIPSVNGYAQNATIWSKENIAGSNLGAKTFDVTEALRNAINTKGLTSIVLRLQTVRGGFKVSGLKTATDQEIPANAPTLKVTTSKKTNITIKYVNEQGKEIKAAKSLRGSVGAAFSYEVQDDEKRLQTEDGTHYVYDESSKTTIDSVVSGDDAGSVITLKYNKVTVQSQKGALSLQTSVGYVPELPEKVMATFSDNSAAEVEVEWDAEYTAASAYGTKGTVNATGKFKGTEVAVAATVTVMDPDDYLMAKYTFDEETEDGKFADVSKSNKGAAEKVNTVTTIEGLSGKAVQLPGKAKNAGSIKLPADLLEKDGTVQDDFTVSMFLRQDANTAGKNAFALMLHADVTYEAWATNKRKNHIALFNMANGQDKGLWVEYNNKNAEDRKVNGSPSAATALGEWTHIAMVTKGSTNEAWLYVNGEPYGYADNIDVHASDLAGRLNYLGKTSWDDVDWAGAYDEFAVYNSVLTRSQVKVICDETLYKAQIEKAKNALEITSADENVEYDSQNVTADLNLPTECAGIGTTVEWASSDTNVIKADGTVIRPSKSEGDKTVTLTATIKAGAYSGTKKFTVKVTALEGVNFSGLTLAIKNAQKQYDQAAAENIYTADSLKIWADAIAAAQEIEQEKDNHESEITAEDVANAIKALEAEMEKTLTLKSFEELNKTLAAWYPLDDAEHKAIDTSGNGIDATAADSVAFSRENGALFNGGKALENCIKLPKDALDELKVTDQMTISFWTNFSENRNLFGIGSNLGENGNDKGGASKHFYVNSALNAYVTANGWASGAHKGFSGVEVSKNEWHHVTAVINGTKLMLYIDKQKVLKDGSDTVETDITMTEAWNYNHGANRYLYIGNCAYGHNGDADCKGSIRDVRIYNAALAEEQVAEVYAYRSTLAMKYAKDVLIEDIGARVEEDGSVILNITNLNTTNKVFTLPKTSYGNAKITWESADSSIINAETGVAAVPDQKGEEKLVDLTATITIGEGENQKQETIVFKCKVYYRNDIPTDDLVNALTELENKRLRQHDYTSASWAALTAAIHTAQAQVDDPTSVQAVADAKSGLEDAESKLVNISGLRHKIEAIENELLGLEEEDYTSASWDGLQDKLDAANTVLETDDATQAQVTAAIETLPESAEAELKRCGNKKVLEDAIADAQALEAYKDAYTDDSWAALTAALQTANEELGKRLEDYAPAAAALQEKMDALAVKEEHKLTEAVKAELDNKLAEAKAENLTSSNYTKETWDNYQQALKRLEEALSKNNATKAEAEDAGKALDTARAALAPVAAQIPSADKKQELTTKYEQATTAAAGMKPEAYTKESWDRYQKALASMKKIADRLAEENNNVTKDEIDAAITELNDATQGLVRNVDKTALNKAISDCASLKSSAYTSTTWNAFQTALNAAKRIAAKADATQQEVNSALATLNAKKAALKKVVKVTKVTLSADSKNIAAGKKVTVKAKVSPSKPTNKSLTWKSSNTKWATVSSKGVVTTKKAGAGKTVTITATAKDGSKKKGTIKIKIMKKGVTKVTLKAKTKKVKAGKKVTVKATVTPSSKKTTNTKLTWKSSNTKWATVNSKGVVTTKKAGKGKTVTITATSTDGTKKSGKIKIKIVK